jgi:hypothetical protein
MEKVDITDTHTPIYGDTMDVQPPYVEHGHNGHLLEISYTDRVFGEFGLDLYLSLVFEPPDPDPKEHRRKP